MANTKVTQELIADDAIGAAQLASNAVVTASIADDAVTSAKLDTNLAVAGSLTVAGTLTANAGVNVDNISIDGTTIGLSTGDLTLDVAGDIILDADGADILFKDSGTTFGEITNSSTDLVIKSAVSDKDMIFKGNDGGSAITALTLDMSDAGTAIFNNKLGVGTASPASGIHLTKSTSGNYLRMDDGSNNLWDFKATANEAIVQVQGTGFSSWKPMDLRANYFTFKPSNTEKMTVKSDGVTATTSARITQVAITSSSNAVAWDSTAAANAYHVTTENTTFSAPSNAVEGAIISVELAQGGTVRTIAWNSGSGGFEFAASTAPTVTATANKTDIFSFRYNGSVWQEIGRVQNLAQT